MTVLRGHRCLAWPSSAPRKVLAPCAPVSFPPSLPPTASLLPSPPPTLPPRINLFTSRMEPSSSRLLLPVWLPTRQPERMFQSSGHPGTLVPGLLPEQTTSSSHAQLPAQSPQPGIKTPGLDDPTATGTHQAMSRALRCPWRPQGQAEHPLCLTGPSSQAHTGPLTSKAESPLVDTGHACS